ncbi:metal-dependent hydrolase [Marinimicrobium sp. LS-A18]|uniref:metal-dependent hydrolase n=1 Tax=Marinimicrobium sp. LS-A18 TaxID=1381596 RepID=UPI000466D56E|nr:metal-dependent hydrolase [Marinimicrobium sp. LS-A18]
MDSLTQMTLGSAVGVAVMGRRVPVWRSALVGAFFGTLPDLDSFVDYGDPIRNVTYHRGASHSLFYLSLLSPLFAWLITRWMPSGGFRRWWAALWLILITHVLLDTMTVYGTQIGQPFTDYPFGVASLFIIDPLYTLPLLVGLLLALGGRHRANHWGLALTTGYLLWSMAAQSWVETRVERELADRDWPVERVLVTPSAFNTLLWRVLVMAPDHYYEGFYALADGDRAIAFDRFERDRALYESLKDDWGVQRIAWFSKGFFKVSARDGMARITDLRMGQEPFYSFNFVVAERADGQWQPVPPQLQMERPDIGAGLRWIVRRAQGQPLSPPRVKPGGGESSLTQEPPSEGQ